MTPDQKRVRMRRWIGLLVLIVSLGLLLWGLWPLQDAVRTLPILPEDMSLPDSSIFLPGLLLFLGSAFDLHPRFG